MFLPGVDAVTHLGQVHHSGPCQGTHLSLECVLSFRENVFHRDYGPTVLIPASF